MTTRTLAALLATMLAASAGAQPLPPAGDPPLRGRGELPSAEALATLPGLDAARQAQLRKILRERRDALDALREKSRAALAAQRKHDRDEAEAIEDRSSERIRALLGDDAYRQYAQWSLERGLPGPHPAFGHPMRGGRPAPVQPGDHDDGLRTGGAGTPRGPSGS
ncbi:MAG: hypothetical protein ACTHK2_00255 [Dokdonella sp.]|uniref:hypothetical protein n=1 Tax=Dokdonella sp. TaxID=2291710 RepID=UPI003F7FEF3F